MSQHRTVERANPGSRRGAFVVALVSLAAVACSAGAGEATGSGEAVASAASGASTIALASASGLCLDVAYASSTNGAAVQTWQCNGGAQQSWAYDGGQLKVYGTKCLDVKDGVASAGTKLQIWDCAAGNGNQQWTRNGNLWQWTGHDLCLDLPGDDKAGGAQVQVWSCGATNDAQQWSFGGAASSGSSTSAGSSSSGGGSSTGGSTGASSGSAPATNPSDGVATIRFKNQCGFAVDVGTTAQSDGFLIQPPFATVGAGGYHDLNLGSDGTEYIGLAYYGRKTGTDPGPGNLTLAEFRLNTSFYHLDYYDVSLVQAYNLPMQIAPLGNASCVPRTCSDAGLLSGCPAQYAVVQGGAVVACSKWRDADNANNAEALKFHASCPEAYSWSGDDTVVRACDTQDYQITFCP